MRCVDQPIVPILQTKSGPARAVVELYRKEEATHVRYLVTSASNSASTVRSTWPVFCIRVVPARLNPFFNLARE